MINAYNVITVDDDDGEHDDFISFLQYNCRTRQTKLNLYCNFWLFYYHSYQGDLHEDHYTLTPGKFETWEQFRGILYETNKWKEENKSYFEPPRKMVGKLRSDLLNLRKSNTS